MKLYLRIACMTFLAALTSNLIAANTSAIQWYQVEIIVFSQLPYGQLQQEQWPYIPPFKQPNNAINLIAPDVFAAQNPTIQPGTQLSSYPLLPAKAFKLDAEANHINHNPNYALITHIAWLQPIISTNKPEPVYIQASNNDSNMDALMALYKDKFVEFALHATFNTNYSSFNKPNSNLQSLNNQGMVRFALNQTLRMRIDELNYIDNPFYGFLVEIFPYKAS